MNNISNTTFNLFDKLKDQIEKIKLITENLNIPDYTFREIDFIFAKYGWYIPPFIMSKTVYEIIELFENNNIDKAERILKTFFKDNLKEIETNLLNNHKERSELLLESFKAHRKKMYFASTILFLSQADGICDSIIFSGKKIKKIKDSKDNHPIIDILTEKNSLTDFYNNKSTNSNYFSDLNRHGVMHGLSNNYGNDLNSLKALSLICYVSDFSRYKKE